MLELFKCELLFIFAADRTPMEKLGELKGTELKRHSLPTFPRPRNPTKMVVSICMFGGAVGVRRSCNKKKHKIKWQRQKCFIKIYMSIICNCRKKKKNAHAEGKDGKRDVKTTPPTGRMSVFAGGGGGRGPVRQWKLKTVCRCRK